VPQFKEEGIVLRTHKLGETDRIITLLTKNSGQVRAVAKGVRKTSSKIGARLEPFMAVEAQFYKGKTLDVVTQVEILGAYGKQIVADYDSYLSGSQILETAERLTRETSTQQHYLLLLGALRSLSRVEHKPGSIANSYQLRALALSGWTPSFDQCSGCQLEGPHERFLVQVGGAVCEECAPPEANRLHPHTMLLLSALLSGEWATVDNADSFSADQANGIIRAFMQWHLERGLKSMNITESK
jgi:DNA repair protein RecO (recombination protein O)